MQAFAASRTGDLIDIGEGLPLPAGATPKRDLGPTVHAGRRAWLRRWKLQPCNERTPFGRVYYTPNCVDRVIP